MPDQLAGRLTDDGHELLQRIYFEDTDFSGRVYHARYLHFLERGRSDYLRLLGIHHQALAADGMGFVVRHMEIDFLQPAAIDDLVLVRTVPRQAGAARIVLAQEVWRAEERLIAATVTVVLVGLGGRPMRLPPAIRAALGKA